MKRAASRSLPTTSSQYERWLAILSASMAAPSPLRAKPAPPRGARGARKRPVAPHLADVEGINAQHAARAPALRLARDQRHLGAGALERRQRPGDEALGAAIGRVALAHDGEPDFPCCPHAARASSSRAAAYTASTGSSVRHSLTLPPPQPSTRHGRQEWLLVISRCSTS